MTLGRRLGALAVAVLSLAGACGGDDKDTEQTSSSSATTTTTVATTASTTTTTTTTSPARSTSTTGPSSTTTKTVATTTTQATRPFVPGFTPAGTYRYAMTGSFTSTLTGTQPRDGESTLVVDPASGTDQHSVKRSLTRTTDQVLRLEGGDALLVSLRLIYEGIDKEVRPSPPGLALPGDAGPGSHWSWRAVSTDTKTTVDSSFRVLRTEDVTVGPDRVEALVVELVLTITGDIVSTSRQMLWISTRHRLVVRQDDTTQGTFGAIAFSGATSETLQSLTPG